MLAPVCGTEIPHPYPFVAAAYGHPILMAGDRGCPPVPPCGRTGRARGREPKSGMQLHFLRL